MTDSHTTPLRVLYDGSAFDMQTHGGVSRCFAELIRALPDDVRAVVGVRNTENAYLKEMGFASRQHFLKRLVEGLPLVGKPLMARLRNRWPFDKLITWQHVPENRSYCRSLLREGQYDVFHPTFFGDWFLPLARRKPMVMTVHDLIPERFPQFYPKDFPQVRQMQRMLGLATHIVAVSEHTKRDLMEVYGVEDERITVVHHGASAAPFTPSPSSPQPYRYVLFVGERHYYKGFGLFCRALAPMLTARNLHAVCTGKPFTADELAMLEGLGVGDRFHQMFVASTDALLNLYHHAEAFVFPSAYEGFGLPILEAYKAAVPVVLRRASCFPEIAGDAAVWFDAEDEDSGAVSLSAAVERVLDMPDSERQSLIAAQTHRLQMYSWESSASRLAAVYRSLV